MARPDLSVLALCGCATFFVESPCDVELCAPYVCSDAGYCEVDCLISDACAEGYICDAVDCVEACQDENCPGGFRCSEFLNECDDICFDNDECRPGWFCCDDYEDPCYDNGRSNECVRE